jgi:hypothetical protein
MPRHVIRGAIVWLVGLSLGSLLQSGASSEHLLGRVNDRGDEGRYQMLAADFHVHTFPGDGALLPWQAAAEARRRGLDAIALTNHNHMLEWPIAAAARSWMPSGIMVLRGEEVTSPGFHIAAIGIRRLVPWSRSPETIIDAIHEQGGVAIAAHPGRRDRARYDLAAISKLDGVELNYPMRVSDVEALKELEAFYATARGARPSIAAIGASDFHREVPLGTNRTFVFAGARTEQGVLDAVRAGRTAACDARGVTTGGQPWADLARDACRSAMSRATLSAARAGGFANAFAVSCALIGLAAMIRPRG